jgi:polyphosphate kinase
MARTAQKQQLFNGRDHSWMQFNRRVLEEAEDPANPLLERVKFLAITGNNLDEYVEVRQAGLLQRIEDGYREQGSTPLSMPSIAAGTSICSPNCANRVSACWSGKN